MNDENCEKGGNRNIKGLKGNTSRCLINECVYTNSHHYKLPH